MGTVGINFGSPTSGTGFDVSATVSQIVANLEKVETPWQTQLTGLDSQDTVLSNLGTLFSKLSTDMSSLTDAQGVLAQKTGSSSNENVLELMSATASAAAGTYAVVVNSLASTANGYLDPITKASDGLSGSITINGNIVDVPSASTGNNTLQGLADAVNSASIGVTAGVVTDANGSRLSLTSTTSGAGGSLNVTSAVKDGSKSLNWNSVAATGANASIQVNGVDYSVASNSVSTVIPGVTFDLLGESSTAVQVIIANDNSDVESTVNQLVTDYNSLVSAMNTQEGNDSSGNPEPLFGSPTLGLLQQELFGSLNMQNPNGYLTAVSSNATLSGSMTIQAGSGQTYTVDVPASPNNTLQGLADAINADNTSTPVSFAAGSGGDSGTMTVSNSAQITGTLAIEAPGGTTETIYLGPSSDAPWGDLATGTSDNTLSSLQSYLNNNSTLSGLGITASIADNGDGTSTMTLNSANGAMTVTSNVEIPGLGVNASVKTSNGQASLVLDSESNGSSGALTVTSSITTNPVNLTYTDAGDYRNTTADSGTLGEVGNGTDTLTGSITIQVGSGTAQTVNVGDSSTADTLSGLASAINDANIGVTASVVYNNGGTESLSLVSGTDGAGGALTVTSQIQDATTTSLRYTASSDVSSLTDLGIGVNSDGTLTFDANSLDSLMNTDYSGVVGFFQNANGWGQSFASMLGNAGTSSSSGILALAQSANSTTESTLNAEITRENSMISAEQKRLTAELTEANQIMQELPSELQGVNELYSAITGYNENTNG